MENIYDVNGMEIVISDATIFCRRYHAFIKASDCKVKRETNKLFCNHCTDWKQEVEMKQEDFSYKGLEKEVFPTSYFKGFNFSGTKIYQPTATEMAKLACDLDWYSVNRIEETLSETQTTIIKLASDTNVHPIYFISYCKAILNKDVSTSNQRRVKVKNYLENRGITVEEILESLGYNKIFEVIPTRRLSSYSVEELISKLHIDIISSDKLLLEDLIIKANAIK